MPEYRKTREGVTWSPTKYDDFSLIKTQHPYKCQRASGRARAFELAADGMLVKDWTQKGASEGFDADFMVGSVLKLMGAKQPGWVLSPTDSNGKTLAEVKEMRWEDPAKLAERLAKAEAREAAQQERMREAEAKAAAEAERKAAKEAEKEAAKAEREAKRAAEKAERAAAKAAREAEEAAAGGQSTEKQKKSKAKKNPLEADQAAQA